MQSKTLIKNATIVNEGRSYRGSVLIEKDIIEAVFEDGIPESVINESKIIDAEGLWLIPGVIDDHVHFRQPGLTHKADLNTESRAAIAGGVTSFMEMPNTQPQTTSNVIWEDKMLLAEKYSIANYSFYLGATNENISEIENADFKRIPGVKVFMGSSTGNMLVDNEKILKDIFRIVPGVVAVHAESEGIIKANKSRFMSDPACDLSIKYHPLIRSAEACYESTARAVELAADFNTRLHVLHLSTKKELQLFENKPLKDKNITCEACVLHLWFDDRDYEKYGNSIKCNPAVKTLDDKMALIKAVNEGLVDVIATDHAPHLISEKQGDCLTAASGAPSIQFSLVAILEMVKRGEFSIENAIEKMCHAPATLYRIEKRGFIKEGYFADLVLVDRNSEWLVEKEIIQSKCGWSPFEGEKFSSKIKTTILNGQIVYQDGVFYDCKASVGLAFNN